MIDLYQLKIFLDGLIDEVYADNEKKSKYKTYYIRVVYEMRARYHGKYSPKRRRITIYNMYRNKSQIVATILHELTHHIDYVNRGYTSHDEFFFKEFKKLLQVALERNILSKEEFESADMDAKDSEKIRDLINT